MKILKIPFDKGGVGKSEGCRKAPDLIIKEAKNFFLTESGFKPSFSVLDTDIDFSNIDMTNDSIFNTLRPLVEDPITGRLCILGGDHSVTYAAFRAFAKKHNGAGLVVFDAHPDCEEDFTPPTHESYLRALISEGILDRNRIILIGIRNWTGDEKSFLDNNRIQYHSMKKITLQKLENIMDSVTESVRSWDATYLSIDIDSADPSCAPGTGYCEPGGLTSRELIYCIQRLKLLKNIRMADIVEVNPEKDINNLTVTLAAKLLVELN